MTDGIIIGKNDAYKQTVQTINNIGKALQQAGAEFSHVVRTRLYVVDIEQWEQICMAHKEFFEKIRPASTMVEVSNLISPDLFIEIEADAYIGT